MLDILDFFSPVLTEPIGIVGEDTETELLHRVYSVSNGPDDGANNLSFRYFSRIGPVKRHATTAEACSNVVSSARARAPEVIDGNLIVLGGHGSPGGFDCGSGNTGYGLYNRIAMGNDYVWKPLLNALGYRNNFFIREVQLHSCETGAEAAGARLVWELAQTIRTNVVARTGLTYYEEKGGTVIQYFQNDSTWQIGLYNSANPPAPIPRTTHTLIKKFRLSESLADISADLKTDLTDIESISITTYNLPDKAPLVFTGDTVAFVISLLFASPLFRTTGEVAGFLTHEVVLQPRNGELINVKIYNESIGSSKKNNCSFFVSQNLADFLLDRGVRE